MGRLLKKKDKTKKQKRSEDSSSLVESGGNSPDGSSSSASSGSTAALKGPGPKPVPKKAVLGSKASVARQEKNFVQKSVQFLKEVKVELKKVTWPTKKATLGSTVVVIVMVMIISLLLGVMDIGLSSLVKVVLQ